MVNSNEEWSIEKYIQEAQREPERLKFWLQYYDYNDACRAVCDNPPRFDDQFKQTFPNPEEFKKLTKENKCC